MADLREQVETLQNALIAQATGGSADDQVYQRSRIIVLEDPLSRELAPKFLKTCRNLGQFWHFIKREYSTYAERKNFIWGSFQPIFDKLEAGGGAPSDESVLSTLLTLDSEAVHRLWSKAMDRREIDPEGAITLARTLLESVCKHILEAKNVNYKIDSDLPALYKATSKELKIAPSQHSEEIFRQILGGCTAVVEGLGALRNRLSDAHGQGRQGVKPAPRHAELAVNLSGAVAQFLISTNDKAGRH